MKCTKYNLQQDSTFLEHFQPEKFSKLFLCSDVTLIKNSTKTFIWKCPLFRDAIDKAVEYKKNPTDIEDQILEELDNFQIDKDTEDKDTEDNDIEDKYTEDSV